MDNGVYQRALLITPVRGKYGRRALFSGVKLQGGSLRGATGRIASKNHTQKTYFVPVSAMHRWYPLIGHR
jgi:hypothetical protein